MDDPLVSTLDMLRIMRKLESDIFLVHSNKEIYCVTDVVDSIIHYMIAATKECEREKADSDHQKEEKVNSEQKKKKKKNRSTQRRKKLKRNLKMKVKLTINLIMDYDCTYGVSQYEKNDAHLIVIPRYYFGSYIDSWFKTEVGEYYHSVLSQINKNIRGIYTYHTEDGDDKYKISDIFEFMLINMEKDTDDILIFAQCSTCNKIGIVGLKTLDYILTFNGMCTCHCHECYFT